MPVIIKENINVHFRINHNFNDSAETSRTPFTKQLSAISVWSSESCVWMC